MPLQAGDVPKTYANVDDLIRDVGFKPNTSIDEGIGKFVKWYKEYYEVRSYEVSKIYDKSPIFFQNFMATVYGYKAKRKRYGKYYYQYLRYLDKIHTYSRTELEKLQFEELMKLLKHTVKNSKFYRELYKGIDINSFQSIDDLKNCLLLQKKC